MARTHTKPDFSEDDYRIFLDLLPDVRRAITVNQRVHQTDLIAELAFAAFDRLNLGVVLLGLKGLPIMANREAKHIAEDGDGFLILGDGPAASRHIETRSLRNLINHVGPTDLSTRRFAGGGIRLTRPSGRPDYLAVVLPLPRRCQPVACDEVFSALFISDSENSEIDVDHLMGDLFRLTAAEQRLVKQLFRGGGLTAAAEQLELSRNTVQTQLSSVFRKTDTGHQSRLMTLLARVVAPFKGPDDSSGFDIRPLKRRNDE